MLRVSCPKAEVRDALDRLVKHGGVRMIALDGDATEVYRLVHELETR